MTVFKVFSNANNENKGATVVDNSNQNNVEANQASVLAENPVIDTENNNQENVNDFESKVAEK